MMKNLLSTTGSSVKVMSIYLFSKGIKPGVKKNGTPFNFYLFYLFFTPHLKQVNRSILSYGILLIN